MLEDTEHDFAQYIFMYAAYFAIVHIPALFQKPHSAGFLSAKAATTAVAVLVDAACAAGCATTTVFTAFVPAGFATFVATAPVDPVAVAPAVRAFLHDAQHLLTM